MTIKRENLYAKIRALLTKTVENGCTEHEALAALDVARAMMAKWEVTEDELRLTKEEAAVLKEAASGVDIGEVRWQLLRGVSEFTGCKGWATNRHLPDNETMVFCGLRSDVEFATWLLEHLERFVHAEIAEFEMSILLPRDLEPAVMVSMMMTSTLTFTNACCARISERLLALARQTAAEATGNTHALIVVKNTAIASAMAKAGITKNAAATAVTGVGLWRRGNGPRSGRPRLVRPAD